MILGLHITSPEITFSKESAATKSLTGLTAGQVVKAKVLGMISPNTASLLMGGQKVTAGTQIPLTPGQQIQLKLIQDQGQLAFKLLPPEQETGPAKTQSGISLANLSRGLQALKILGKHPSPELKDILNFLSLKSGKRDEAFLPRLVRHQGLTMEKQIASIFLARDKSQLASGMNQLVKTDVKAALLQMLARETESAPDSSAAKTIRTVLGVLDNFQTLNTQTGDVNRFILPFPVMAGEAFTFGQLLIDLGKHAKEGSREAGDQVTQLAFLLNMTNLGSVRADFSVLNKAITGRFLLADDATCAYMAGLIPDLQARLQGLDFQVSRITCQTAPANEFSADALVKSWTDSEDIQGLNLVV